MTYTGVGSQTMKNAATPESSGGVAQGWYFYGITLRGPLAAVLEAADADVASDVWSFGARTTTPLQLLEFSGLAAVVRAVPLADFSLSAMQERLQDASALEEMVRRHNRVIETIHAQQAILPAKFGVVYAHADEAMSALEPEHDTLLRQLRRLAQCDEWAVHLYVDRTIVRQRISMEDPTIRRLREAHATARPGRAYFLEQQLRTEVDTATEQVLTRLAQTLFDRLARYAVAGHVNPIKPDRDLAGDIEILRACFLVSRDGAEQFKDEVRSSGASIDGLRSEYTGPWPPYSFADHDDGSLA